MKSVRSILLGAALLGLVPGAAAADATPSPPPYGPPITLAEARSCVAAAEAEATKNQWFVVVTVLDAGGHEVLTERMDNAQFGSIGPAERKAWTAVSFRRPSKFFEDIVTQGGSGLRILRLDEVMPIEGGLPILRGGAVIGAVGVSGATAPQDGVVAAACAAAMADPPG